MPSEKDGERVPRDSPRPNVYKINTSASLLQITSTSQPSGNMIQSVVLSRNVWDIYILGAVPHASSQDRTQAQHKLLAFRLATISSTASKTTGSSKELSSSQSGSRVDSLKKIGVKSC